ncbi:Tautomerase/MIF superfamily [Lasiosphaeria hispida]|uniref:L-dopachrome isomerase n=1 Tax=Lasiosphaeria hispida TaxID=260671 RepID=A0AAJ0HM98_9PEZI|nr:Tautomerase/MIF superfamily [Lasiosphaeria hispida]
MTRPRLPSSDIPSNLVFSSLAFIAPGGVAGPSKLVEGGQLTRGIDRPLPGDVGHRARKSHSKQDLGKKRSNVNFFEDFFGVNESNVAKERVRGDAMVMAEVKTNVIISDEFSFITELSYHLSTRYQRPVSSIVVTLHHGACMFFGGSFDAAYAMSIFALPSQLLPTTNKRNAALIQKHMEEGLGVPPSRGLLRFVPTEEEHLACNGKTMAGEIDELEKSYGASPTQPVADDALGASRKRSGVRKKMSVKSFASFRPPSGIDVPAPELTPPASADEALPVIPASPGFPASARTAPEGPIAPLSDVPKRAKRKKSFVATIFSRAGGKSDYSSTLPTISGRKA